MLRGVKDFILRGNVVDLAVAVVIGAAFGAIVTAFTSGIVRPLVNSITPPSSAGLGLQLIAGKDSSYLDFSLVVTALANFVIVAAVVYFVFVLPLNKLKARRQRGQEAGPAEPTDVELLKEIRDLLHQQVAADEGDRSPDGRTTDRATPGATAGDTTTTGTAATPGVAGSGAPGGPAPGGAPRSPGPVS